SERPPLRLAIERISIDPFLVAREQFDCAGRAAQPHTSFDQTPGLALPLCDRFVDEKDVTRCAREQGDTPGEWMPREHVNMADPPVIHVRVLEEMARLDIEIQSRCPYRHSTQGADLEDIPRNRKPLRPIAEMSRHVVKSGDELGFPDSGRR